MTAIEPTEAVTISGKGPNDPAMMLCAKLAELGVVVKISTMRKALRSSAPQEPDDDADEDAVWLHHVADNQNALVRVHEGARENLHRLADRLQATGDGS